MKLLAEAEEESMTAKISHDEIEELRAGVLRLIAERKTLAKHCVVVIHERGLQLDVQWCTVCGARLQSWSLPFKHNEGCLVEKVLREA